MQPTHSSSSTGNITTATRLALPAGLACLALVNALVLFRWANVYDDAYIFARYADNLVAGHGLTFNPGGEHVEGYTSFLYVVTLALFRLLGASPITGANLLNLVLYGMVTLTAGSLLARMGDGRWGRASTIACLLIATNQQFGMFARSGMESMLFAFLLLLSLRLHGLREKSVTGAILSGLVFALTELTRPEGLMFFGIYVLWAMLEDRRDGRPMLNLGAGLQILSFALVVMAHLLWRHSYYGDWLPNTYYAKVGGDPLLRARLGLDGFRLFVGTFPGTAIITSLGVWLIAARDRFGSLLAMLTLAFTAVLIWQGLDAWDPWWYTTPLYLFASLLLGWGLERALRDEDRSAARLWLGLVIALAAGVALFGKNLVAPGDALEGLLWIEHLVRAFLLGTVGLLAAGRLLATATTRRRVVVMSATTVAAIITAGNLVRSELCGARCFFQTSEVFVQQGLKLKEISSREDTLAVGACGAIPYLSGLVTYDTFGLNDRHIARLPLPEQRYGGFGHDKGDGAYILGKRPTYLIPVGELTDEPRPAPYGDKTFSEIFAMPELARNYEFKSIEMPNGKYFNFYKRRPPVVAAPPPGGESSR